MNKKVYSKIKLDTNPTEESYKCYMCNGTHLTLYKALKCCSDYRNKWECFNINMYRHDKSFPW